MDDRTDHSMLSWPYRPRHDVVLVGVINASPDSYLRESYADTVESAVERARAHIRSGAHVIEVGGQSGSVFASRVSAEVETARTIPYIRAIHEEFPQVEISVDTFRSEVARAGIEAGATWLNDVTALRHDPDMMEVVAQSGCRVVLMHLDEAGGRTGRYLHRVFYEDVTKSVRQFFVHCIDRLTDAGVDRRRLVIDIGLGGSKRPAHDYDLLAHVRSIVELGVDVMVGPSRKGFIRIVAPSTVDDLTGGSVAAALWAVLNGARYLRVHDPRPYAQAIDVWNALSGALTTAREPAYRADGRPDAPEDGT